MQVSPAGWGKVASKLRPRTPVRGGGPPRYRAVGVPFGENQVVPRTGSCSP